MLRGVVFRPHQMSIAGACSRPRGHTDDLLARCGLRGVHAHPVWPVRLAVWSRSPYKRQLATEHSVLIYCTVRPL